MTLSYDGHNLESLFICGEPQISILNSQPELVDRAGGNGSVFIGTRYGDSTVSFTIAAVGTLAQRRDKFSTLGQWLKVGMPKKLILPEYTGADTKYYNAVPSGALAIQHGVDGDWAVLTFTLTDPVAYSNTESSVTSSGGVATFTVGGTAPTYVTITSGTAQPDSETNIWRVNLGSTTSSTFMAADVGTQSSGHNMTIDMEGRTFVYYGQNRMPTLDSKWFSVDPGQNNLYRTKGTGEFTVKWRNRWY